MAKQQREKSTRAQWAKLVRWWKQSGLTAAEFAAREDLVAATLAWWRWKLAKRDGRASARRQTQSVSLVPMHIMSSPSAAAAEATTTPIEISCGRCLVRVSAGFDRATLIATPLLPLPTLQRTVGGAVIVNPTCTP